MANQPWFKFYAADYLLDSRVDGLPLEAHAVLIRMWCLCHNDRFCPTDPDEIARKALLSGQAVRRYYEQLLAFFEVRDGRLYSRRMEEEKRKSEAAQQGGRKRGEQLRSANRLADGSSNCSTQSQDQSHSQYQIQNPPSLETQSLHLKEKRSQKDFEARDRRKLAEAFRRIELQIGASVGSRRRLTEKEIFEWACRDAGISVERGLEIEESGRKWPQSLGPPA